MIRPEIRRWYFRRSAVLVAAGIAIVVTVLIVRDRTGDRAGGAATAAMPGMNAGGSGSVTLTDREMGRFGVTFGTVELRPLSSEVRTVGTVVADETRMAKVTPKFSGYIERLYTNFTGQPVRRGQPLATVFSPGLLAAEQELLVAARLSRAMGTSGIPGVPANPTGLVAAARERLRLWDVSDAEIDAVLRTGRPLRTVTLRAPVSGIVTEKNVVQGQAIQAGEELYTISDLSSVWVEAELREADAGRVAPGTTALIELSAYPGQPLTGRVSYVYPTLTSATRTVRARIILPNPGGRVKPGMYATVTLKTATGSALTVPRSAVLQTGERSLVFVDAGGGRLVPHTVQLGRSGSDFVEVLSGVSRGQRVVTSAQFLIDSESNLGELMKGMAGMGADTRGMPGMASPPVKR